MQIKHWVLVAGLLAGGSMLAACGEEKKADEAAPPAAGETAPATEPAPAEAPAE